MVENISPTENQENEITTCQWKYYSEEKLSISCDVYKKVDETALKTSFQEFTSIEGNIAKDFPRNGNSPYYENLIIYLLKGKKDDQEKTESTDAESRRMTQNQILKELENFFSGYGYSCSQSSVSKALNVLAKPFACEEDNEHFYTVASERLESTGEYGDRLTYYLVRHKDEIGEQANRIYLLFKDKVATRIPHVIRKIRRQKDFDLTEFTPSSFAFRFKSEEYAQNFKLSLMENIAQLCFFKIIVYEDTVIILLNTRHKNFWGISQALSKMFLHSSQNPD